MPNIAAFLSYVCLTSFTPGPNNIMSMTNASKYGFKKSITFNIGIFIGFFITIVLCSFFSLTLYNLLPSIKPIISVIGAAYILLLAWKTFKSSDHHTSGNETYTNTFLSGLFMQFVNPKVILLGITTVSSFIIPYYNSVVILILFSVLLAFIGFVSTCCWSLFGALFQKFMIKNHNMVKYIMTMLLIYCAVSLLI